MIISSKPLAMGQAESYYKSNGEEKKPIEDYFKTFIKLSKNDCEKLMDEIKTLNNPKLKEEYIVKLADLLPKDAEDVNKILLDINLSEGEANAILEITKKY